MQGARRWDGNLEPAVIRALCGSGYLVNNFETGEWLNYTVSVTTAGTYTISLNVSSEMTTGVFQQYFDFDSVQIQ